MFRLIIEGNAMTDRRLLQVVLLLVLTAGISAAQNETPSSLRYEAASIRPSAPGGPPISGTTISANRLRGTRVTLLGLIRSAFGEGLSSDEQFVGGPDWIRSSWHETTAGSARS